MSFAAMMSVGTIGFHGVWDYKGRLPHGAGATWRARRLLAGWLEHLDFHDIRGFRVLLRG